MLLFSLTTPNQYFVLAQLAEIIKQADKNVVRVDCNSVLI